MTKLLSNIGQTVDPKGYCLHHSAIKLRRQSQPSGEWKTLLSHCPLCSDDGSTLSPRGGRESPSSSLLSLSTTSLTSTSSRRSSGRYGRLNRQTTPAATTLAAGLSRLDSSSSSIGSSIGSSTRSHHGATYSRLDSSGSINSVNSRRSYHTSSSENRKARELRRLSSSRSRPSSFAKSCSDIHQDGDNEYDDHDDDSGRKASTVSRTATQYTKDISMYGLSSMLSTDTTVASSTSSSCSGSHSHCQQKQEPPSRRPTTCSSPVSPSSHQLSESVASSERSRKWLLPPPMISPLTPASPESEDCDDIASSCSSLMRRKQLSFNTTSTADTANASNYTKLNSTSSSNSNSSKNNNANKNKKAIVCGLRYTDPATSNHGSYTGQLHPFSQLPHGMGTLRCADGNVCEGKWCDGILLTTGNESRVQSSKVRGGGRSCDNGDDVAACASDLKSCRVNAIDSDVCDDDATATDISGRKRSVQDEGKRGGDNKTNGSRSHSKARGGASSGNNDDDASSASAAATDTAVPRRMRNVQDKGRDGNRKANRSRSHSKTRGGVPSINHDDDDITASPTTSTSRRTRGARGESRGSDRKSNGSISYSKARGGSSYRNYDDDASATSESMSSSRCKVRQGAAHAVVATSRLTKSARGRGGRSIEAEGGEGETTSPSDKDDVSTASAPAESRRSSMSMGQSRGRRQVADVAVTRKMARSRSRGRGSEEPTRVSNRSKSNSRSGGRSIFLPLMGTSGCDEDCSSTIGDCPPSDASAYTSNDAQQHSQLLICADPSSGSSSASWGGGERAQACSRGDCTPGRSGHRGKEGSGASHEKNRAEIAIDVSSSPQFEREDIFEQRQQRQPILQRALVPYVNKTNQERRLEENESNIIGDNNLQGTCEKNPCSRRSQGRSCARMNRRVSFDSTSRPPSGPYSARESKGTPSSNASVGPRLNEDSAWSTRRGSVGLLKESKFRSSASTTAAKSGSRSDCLLRLRSRQEGLEQRRGDNAGGGGGVWFQHRRDERT